MVEKSEEISEGRPDCCKKPRKPKKAGIVAGVLVVVVAVAGVGFWVWHEQPSFCGAICHTPMDPYLATYEQAAGSEGVDKWGNEVENTDALLAVSHREADAVGCIDCHIPTLSQQVSEGVSWVSGSYDVVENSVYGVVVSERSLEELVEASGSDAEEFCLNEVCHANENGDPMTWDDLAELTSSYGKRNPHLNEHGNSMCSDCHKAHRASVMQCTECHGDANVPDGWLTASQAKQLANKA